MRWPMRGSRLADIRSSERLQHIAYQGLREIAGEAVDGGGVFADEAAEVLGGLVLLAVGERVVLIEDAAVARGEHDLDGDGEEVAGGLAAGGVVGERDVGLGEEGAGEDGEDALAATIVEKDLVADEDVAGLDRWRRRI